MSAARDREPDHDHDHDHDYDVVVVGSGFGGSVSALRLAEKGYRVGVLEAGRRFTDESLPKTSWRLRRFLWLPRLGLRGLQRISFLRGLVVLSGAGVGGGSLVYANVLYRPPETFYRDRQWAHLEDWRAELEPHYETAERMLGRTVNPTTTRPDEVLREVAEELGAGSSFQLTPVGVFFGEPGVEVPDPYFGGDGPARRGCIECGECMIGCRYGAKNRLDVNYLHLAARHGAEIVPDSEVVGLRPREGEGYELDVRAPGPWPAGRRTVRARQVVLAAGPLGTQRLLLRMRDEGVLPRLSPALGRLFRSNSQSLRAATTSQPDARLSRGVAITSSVHPSGDTHVEPVRYGRGSNFMGGLFTVLLDREGSPEGSPWRVFAHQAVRAPAQVARFAWLRRWSERTVVLVVMQTLDNSLTVRRVRSRFGRERLETTPGHGAANPEWIPSGNEVTRRVAERLGGRPGGTLGELVGAPMTAHPIGGCVIGDGPETGVVDRFHRVYGYDGLHIADGSVVPANLGANPALTITAMAERAMSLWPARGEDDERPAVQARTATVGSV